jgi:hypothetical protein
MLQRTCAHGTAWAIETLAVWCRPAHAVQSLTSQTLSEILTLQSQ